MLTNFIALNIERFKRIRKILYVIGTTGTINYYYHRAFKSDSIIRVPIADSNICVFLRPSDSDINVLIQVFADKECAISLNYNPKIIIDGGAYVGYTALFFTKKYPDAKIIAIEPDDKNYERLLANCSGQPNIIPIKAALWNSNSYLRTFKLKNQYSWQIQVKEVPISRIKGITINDLLDKYKISEIDLLKIDIEGAEKYLFSAGYSDWIHKVRTMIIEVHGEECEEIILKKAFEHKFFIYRQGERLILTKTSQDYTTD
jgi:FkbM family methyltransferase